MKLAQRDSLDVDRRIPVTEIRHQLLFKTQNNFFRENLTMDNSLREKRHQQDGSSCKKLKVEYKLLYKALLYSWWRISVTGILRSTFYESQLTTLKKSLTKIQISRAFWFISFLQCGADSISRPLAGYEAFSFTFSRFMGVSKFHRN